MKLFGFSVIKSKTLEQTRSLLTGAGDYFNWLLGTSGGMLPSVSNEQAQRIEATFLSLKILSETIASLPWKVYQDSSTGGRVIRKDNTVYYAIHIESNDFSTSYDFIHSMVWDLNAHGNAVAVIDRDFITQDANRFTKLNINEVSIKELDGRLKYLYRGTVYDQSDILHFKINSRDGKIGRSAISTCIDTFSTYEKQKTFGTKSLEERPPGFLTSDGNLTDDQRRNNMEQWKSMVSKGTPVLSGGMKYVALSLPPADVQLLETKKLTVAQIYSLFRIPPTYAQNYDTATYNNVEGQQLAFVIQTLTPIVTAMEQELNRKVFRASNAVKSSPFYVKAEFKGLLRGDINTRRQYYEAMWSRGILSGNEIRVLEDMSTFDGGDRRFIQAGFIPIDRADDFIDSKTKTQNTETNGN